MKSSEPEEAPPDSPLFPSDSCDDLTRVHSTGGSSCREVVPYFELHSTRFSVSGFVVRMVEVSQKVRGTIRDEKEFAACEARKGIYGFLCHLRQVSFRVTPSEFSFQHWLRAGATYLGYSWVRNTKNPSDSKMMTRPADT